MRWRSKLCLVYQMGKVGSSALVDAIPGAIHLHTFYKGRHWMLGRFEQKSVPNTLKDFFWRMKLRLEVLLAKEVKVITLVRDPHARNVSCFFQRIYVDINYYYQDNNIPPRRAGLADLNKAFEYNTDRLKNYLFDDWFEGEFRSVTGINVFSSQYDFDKGYQVFERGNIKVFVTRYEDLDRCLPGLSAFLGKEITLRKVNAASQKWYSCIYSEFKKSYVPSESYMAKLKASRTYKHFYDPG